MDESSLFPSFNLWREPWITVERRDGRTETLSTAQTLLHAHEYVAIYEPSPLVVAGIHRLLTAILQWTFDPRHEKDIAALWRAGHFPATDIETFGKQYAHRFDLFAPDEPFMQSGDIPLKASKSNLSSVAKLSPEIPASGFVTHFRHGTEDDQVFCPGCVAKGLVIIPAFSAPGGRGYGTGVNRVPPVYILPGGRSLFESLTLSLVAPAYKPPTRIKKQRLPWWQRSPVVEERKKIHEVDYLQSLTFPARRVRIHLPTYRVHCTRCGRFTKLGIHHITFSAGENYSSDAELWLDPFVAYRKSGKERTGKLVPIRVNAKKSLWREYALLFLETTNKNTHPPGIIRQMAELSYYGMDDLDEICSFRCIGYRTDRAKVIEWIDAGFEVPLDLLRDPDGGSAVLAATDFSGKCEGILKWVFNVHFKKKYTGIRTHMTQTYWRRLANPFRQFVVDIAPVASRADVMTAWVEEVRQIAQDVFEKATAMIGDDAVTLRQWVEGEAHCRASLIKAMKEQKELIHV